MQYKYIFGDVCITEESDIITVAMVSPFVMERAGATVATIATLALPRPCKIAISGRGCRFANQKHGGAGRYVLFTMMPFGVISWPPWF